MFTFINWASHESVIVSYPERLTENDLVDIPTRSLHVGTNKGLYKIVGIKENRMAATEQFPYVYELEVVPFEPIKAKAPE